MKLKRIVNIMPDDKFLDYYIELSETFIPEQSSYLIFKTNEQLTHIKSRNKNLFVYDKTESNYLSILNQIENDSIIIFHSFHRLQKKFISSLPLASKKIWIFWGIDGYATIPKSHLLEQESDYNRFEKSLKGVIKFLKNRILDFRVSSIGKAAIDIIKKMDYCATWIDDDYLLAKKINSSINNLYFNYYTKELMGFENLQPLPTDSSKLFLGNSANPTNNHFEALNYLNNIKFKGEIFCPLSYGGSKIYVRNVIKHGNKFFGEKFIPLIDFIPLEAYQQIINNCGIVWMNHKRQQGAGNLLVGFCTRKIIILHKKNPMYSTFMKWGLTFYEKDILVNLHEMELDKLDTNRDIILDNITIQKNEAFFKTIQIL